MATWQWSGDVEIGPSGQRIVTGTGDPEGAVTAPIGSIYFRVDGGSNHAVYIKEGGSGNTGWTAIGASGTTVTLRHDGIANSLQNILDLISGNGMTLADLGSGRIQISGPLFKTSGIANTYQPVLDLRVTTGLTIADIGGGRVQLGWINPLTFEVNSSPASSSLVHNLVDGVNTTVHDNGGGSIQINAAQTNAPSATVTSLTTGSLNTLSANAYSSSNTESGFVNLYKAGMLLKVVAGVGARVRLYSTAALRDADLTRTQFVPPTPGTEHGVYVDLFLDGIEAPLTWNLNPIAIFANADVSPSTKIYYNVTNLSGSTQTVTVTFTHVESEN